MSRRRESLTLLWHGPVNRTTCAAIAVGDAAAVYIRTHDMWCRYTQTMTRAQADRWWVHCLPQPRPEDGATEAIDHLIRSTRPRRHQRPTPLTGAVR